MLIAIFALLAATGLALFFRFHARRARAISDPDGPRTLFPGLKG